MHSMTESNRKMPTYTTNTEACTVGRELHSISHAILQTSHSADEFREFADRIIALGEVLRANADSLVKKS